MTLISLFPSRKPIQVVLQCDNNYCVYCFIINNNNSNYSDTNNNENNTTNNNNTNDV